MAMLAACAAGVCSLTGAAATLSVAGGDVAALTNALATAANGDVIELAEGVYDVSGCAMATGYHLDLEGKNGVTLRGAEGTARENVILRGAGMADTMRGISLASNNSAGTNVLAGLTVEACGSTNGMTGPGGVQLGDWTVLTNCIVRNCWAGGGAGVWMKSASSLVVDCVVSNNVGTNATYSGGAGIAANGVAGYRIVGCTIAGNSSTAAGGGVYAGICEHCLIYGNTCRSRDGGGGIGRGNSVDCVISNNFSYFGGGGVLGGVHSNGMIVCNYALGGTGGGCSGATMIDCLIADNEATKGNGGGGMGGTYIDCIIERNRIAGGTHVGGAGINGGTATNCVIRGNVSNVRGGATMGSTLVGCRLEGNQGASGIIFGGTLTRCAVIGNTNLHTSMFGEAGTCDRCVFAFNEVTNGTSVFVGLTVASNCLFYANTNTYALGNYIGVFCGGALVNCTVADNVIASGSGGVLNGSKATSVMNTLFSGNTKGEGASGDLVYYYSAVALTNCVWDGTAGRLPLAADVDNVVATDAKFLGGTDFSYSCLTNADTSPFAIKKDSPARNKGNNAFVGDGETDLGGTARIADDIVDIGCFEYFSRNRGFVISIR